MTAKLTPDQISAIQQQGGPIQVVDPNNNRIYVVVDIETHQQAMDAKRKLDDLKAIQQGIDDSEAGRVQPLAEAFAELRESLLGRKPV